MDGVVGQGAGVLTGEPPIGERSARYDAWFATPLGAAMDDAESLAVLELAAPRRGERALDAGCGTGLYTRRLVAAGAMVTGVDADEEMLAAARVATPGAAFFHADIAALPFGDGAFDLTLAVTVLCFVADPPRVVRELVRVTRPGGRVVLAELNSRSPWAAWRRIRGRRGSTTWRHARFYTPRELARLLDRSGAQTVRTRSAAYLPPGAPAWLCARSRSVERRARGLGSLGAAFSVARGEVGAR